MTLPIPTKPLPKEEPTRWHTLLPAAIALLAVVAVAGYMLYDDYSRSNEPVPSPAPGSGIFPGDMDVETDFLLHSIRGQRVSDDLTVQAGETVLTNEPGDLPVPPFPKSSREYGFRRPLSGLTEDVSIWTIPGNVTTTQVAEFYRDAAIRLGYNVHSGPNLNAHRHRRPGATTNPTTHPTVSEMNPTPPTPPAGPMTPEIPAPPISGEHKHKPLLPPPRQSPEPASFEPQPPPEEEEVVDVPAKVVNIVMVRPRSFPPASKTYLPPQVLVIRARTLKSGAVRLLLSVRYSTLAIGPQTSPSESTDPPQN